MTEPQFNFKWEFGLPAAGPLLAFAASPGGRVLLGSFKGLERNRFIILDQEKSQLMCANVDTGNHVITCTAWGPNLHFFTGNDCGDVYCGYLQKNGEWRFAEILAGLGAGRSIIAVSFSCFQQILAVAIGSQVHTYRLGGADFDNGANWTHLKSIGPFGDDTAITAMRFVGSRLNQLLIGSSEGMSVWLTEDFTIRPLTADYAFSVLQCATTSRANYIGVTTQAHTVILWPLFDSGPATYERRVINITGRESSDEDVSPLALTDSGFIITRSMASHIYFKRIARPSETGRLCYGTHCKITSLEAQGEYLFTGGNSPTGLLAISCWSRHPPEFDQDPQRPIPITHLRDILRTLERPVTRNYVSEADTLQEVSDTSYYTIRRVISFFAIKVMRVIVLSLLLSAGLYSIILISYALQEFVGPEGAHPSMSSILVIRTIAYQALNPSIIVSRYAMTALKHAVITVGYVFESLGVEVTKCANWVAGGALVIAMHAFFT
ncbi:transmembrane protein, putative, partial [Rhizoctonia solani AG-3 Rhs1AP]